MPQIKLLNKFRICRETTLLQKGVFVSVQADRNCLLTNRFEIRSPVEYRLFSRLDMLYTGRLGGIVQRFSALPMTPFYTVGKFSALQSDKYAGFVFRCDANFLSVLRYIVSFESVNDRLPMKLSASFGSIGNWLAQTASRNDAINTASRLLLAAKLDSVIPRFQRIAERFAAQNFVPTLKTSGKCDYLLLYRQLVSNTFIADDGFGGCRLFHLPIRYDKRFEAIYRLCSLFEPGFRERLAASYFRFGSLQNYLAQQNVNCFSFVKPGWRIIATNISTGEEHEIGFIDVDAATSEISGVSLPDGDYEITVLTSSLFWKDTHDTNNRLIKLCEDEELSPLPVIYNLRTSVSNGTRTVSWSANKSEVDDCVFGVWFSETTPVDIDRPADKTIWYSPEMTEYSMTFSQNTPCFAAVAAIRTGDNPETGSVVFQ